MILQVKLSSTLEFWMSENKQHSVTNEDRINTPANIVTIIRVCLIPVFVAILLCPWPEWFGFSDIVDNHMKAIVATVIFVVISATDWLDGYLARSRSEVTTFGKFMDPLADKMLVIAALLALVELRVIPSWPLLIIIGREFIVSGIRMIAASRNVVIAASMLGKAKTLFQIIAIVLFLLKEGISINTSASALESPLYLIAWAVMLIALVLTIVSMIDYLKFFKNIATKNNDGDDDLRDRISKSASTLLNDLKQKNLKVITAESLTGGLISASLTSIPGSSSVVVGGVASYAFELKRDALSVDYDHLQKSGAVNERCALEMARGALALSVADIAVSVTGIAGPGGEEEGKPVGTVYMAIVNKKNNEEYCERFLFDGDRDTVRLSTTLKALEELRECLSKI